MWCRFKADVPQHTLLPWTPALFYRTMMYGEVFPICCAAQNQGGTRTSPWYPPAQGAAGAWPRGGKAPDSPRLSPLLVEVCSLLSVCLSTTKANWSETGKGSFRTGKDFRFCSLLFCCFAKPPLWSPGKGTIWQLEGYCVPFAISSC